MRATSRTIIRAWTKDGYHKDIAVLDSEQVRMSYGNMEPKSSQFTTSPIDATRLCVDPKDFPEMEKFEVIVEEYKR